MKTQDKNRIERSQNNKVWQLKRNKKRQQKNPSVHHHDSSSIIFRCKGRKEEKWKIESRRKKGNCRASSLLLWLGWWLRCPRTFLGRFINHEIHSSIEESLVASLGQKGKGVGKIDQWRGLYTKELNEWICFICRKVEGVVEYLTRMNERLKEIERKRKENC